MTIRWPTRAVARDVVSYVVGVSGIIYEAVIYSGPPRWPLLAVYMALAGIPGAVGLDSLRKRVNGRTIPSEPKEPAS